MSKIAANESYGGNALRKAIDYFCHVAVAPDFYDRLEKIDPTFAKTEFYSKISWLRSSSDDIYDPAYTDMLRVAFTSEFGRGRLQDLVALLSGRNFETKQFEEEIAETSFASLKRGVLNFMNQTHFQRLLMILRSAGFITRDLLSGQNSLNFAYIIYLRSRADNVPSNEIERLVRRWFVMSMLTGRYAGNPETAFDFDIRQIASRGVPNYVDSVVDAELSDGFWSTLLPQQMETSSASSPYFKVFQAAQVKLADHGFLSRDIKVLDLILNRADVHHIFPRKHLKDQGLARGRYNQIANYVLAQSEINIAIGEKAPEKYFAELKMQCNGGKKRYGGITELNELKKNFHAHCIPMSDELMSGKSVDYDQFLEARRGLMAQRMKEYFLKL